MHKKNKYDLKHKVDRSPNERARLREITTKGRHSVRVVKRAQIFQKSDDGRMLILRRWSAFPSARSKTCVLIPIL